MGALFLWVIKIKSFAGPDLEERISGFGTSMLLFPTGSELREMVNRHKLTRTDNRPIGTEFTLHFGINYP